MLWYTLFSSLSVLIVLSVWYFVYDNFLNKKYPSFYRTLADNKSYFFFSVLIALAFVFYLCYKPLMNTIKCSMHGLSMQTETSYSWVMSKCLMKTKTGAWLPVNINRDAPEGTSNNEVTNNAQD